MAYENHWLPGFNFNVEEWFEGHQYETLAICRTLALAHAVFAAAVAEKPAGPGARLAQPSDQPLLKVIVHCFSESACKRRFLANKLLRRVHRFKNPQFPQPRVSALERFGSCAREVAMSNMKAATLLGLSLAVTVISAANAATLSRTTSFSVTTAGTEPGMNNAPISFPQFDTSLGTLTGVALSLSSTIGNMGPDIAVAISVLGRVVADGPDVDPTTGDKIPVFTFSDLSLLRDGLTLADFTGNGSIAVVAALTFGTFSDGTAWSGSATLSYIFSSRENATAPSATPLPAGLPLFATGLGGLGLLGWGRKRKAHVDLLGAA